MFGRLNITLVRATARAILARNVVPSDFNNNFISVVVLFYLCAYVPLNIIIYLFLF